MAGHVALEALDILLQQISFTPSPRTSRILKPIPLSIQIFDKNASKELRKIGKYIKIIIIHFIKHSQSLLFHQIIPTHILYIIVEYYGYKEAFCITGLPIAISSDNLTIQKLKLQMRNPTLIKYAKDNINWRCQSAFGQKLIITRNNDNIYEWTFKINQGGSAVFVIGIAGTTTNFYKYANRVFYDMRYNYGFNIYNGRKVHNQRFMPYGDACKSGDNVMMRVNMNDGSIIYFINGVSQGTAFENIKRGKLVHYKLAITLQEPGDGCTMIDFKEIEFDGCANQREIQCYNHGVLSIGK